MIKMLERFRPELRPYQVLAVRNAVDFAASVGPATPMGRARRRMYSAPTGTGKGTIQLAVHRALGGRSWIVTPSLDIVRGYVERLVDEVPASESALMRVADEARITTPARAVNRMRRGEMAPPDVLIGDEAHHLIMANQCGGDLLASLSFSVVLGYTATPYRGSPPSTLQLRGDWGDPVELLTVPDAVAGGWMTVPDTEMVPLVDDDRIEIAGGDFRTAAARDAYASRIDDLVRLTLVECAERPSMVTVPDRAVFGMLTRALACEGSEVAGISARSTRAEREAAFTACRERRAPLVVIRCATEGFDAPWLGCLVDARPTVSPVLWMQTIGRVCRPGGPRRYICTNRNLERHAYLFGGAMPPARVAEASAAFPEASSRAGLRQIGLEPLARFRRISVPLRSGGRMAMFLLYSMDGMIKTEWCVMIPPGAPEPLVARRVSSGSDWGRWRRSVMPGEFVGFQTSRSTDDMSDKMESWWRRSAGRKGLDPEAKVNRRQFVALPVLHHLGLKVR